MMTTTNDSSWQQQLTSPVAVLLGGNSAEREVSLNSGAAVLAALQSSGIDARAVDTADSDWLTRVATEFKHTFIALHGLEGEDGTVQGALQMLGLSYTGSGVMASALAMDKLRSKQLWKGIDFPTADFCQLDDATDFDALMARWGTAMVKPSHEGSSIGMARVETGEQLLAAFKDARKYDAEVLAEQWIQGREFTVAVLDGRALPAIQLQTDHSFYDYEAKYVSDDTDYLCPCGLSEAREAELKALAIEAFDSLGCSGWGRVDFMEHADGTFYALEVNTVPGMTDHSLVPMAAKAAGLDFQALVLEILRLSLQGELS